MVVPLRKLYVKSDDPDDSVSEEPNDLLTMVKNYLPDDWKAKTSTTNLAFTDGKLTGTISYTKDAKKTYTITVANGIVTGVE